MQIRRPIDKLSGVCWLPRLIDKTNHTYKDTLTEDYAFAFCHPKGIDGAFLNFFDLSKEDFLEAVKSSDGDDSKVAEWFLKQPGVSEEKIQQWNTLAPTLGAKDQPMHNTFLWVQKNIVKNCDDPTVDTIFKILDWDEGHYRTGK
ncbi:MAG: DUF5069 domain-containing protein [Chthoniobacterales bacterium]